MHAQLVLSPRPPPNYPPMYSVLVETTLFSHRSNQAIEVGFFTSLKSPRNLAVHPHATPTTTSLRSRQPTYKPRADNTSSLRPDA